MHLKNQPRNSLRMGSLNPESRNNSSESMLVCTGCLREGRGINSGGQFSAYDLIAQLIHRRHFEVGYQAKICSFATTQIIRSEL